MGKVIRNEIIKLYEGKKIYIFMVILFAASFLNLASALITRNVYSLGRQSGQTFPLSLFSGLTCNIIFPIFVIILIASMVTDEYVDGSLKLPLLQKVSRTRLLLGKTGALSAALLILLCFLMILGYGVGTFFLGFGDKFLVKGETLSLAQGIKLTILTYGLSILSFTSFGMLVLLPAVLMSNSGSVVGISMAILFASLFIGQAFPEISPYLVTSYFNTFNILTSRVGIEKAFIGFVIVFIYGVVFFILSSFIFNRKDLLL